MKNLKQRLDKIITLIGVESDIQEKQKLNEIKAEMLMKIKPSTKETILYFDEKDTDFIQNEFEHCNKIYNFEQKFDIRAKLEYNDSQRHPIPYIMIKHKDKYFFILREQGSGEMRLIGKKGMVGGHIDDSDIGKTVQETVANGMYRELEEETGITKDMIIAINLKGYIKGNDGVDSDHLGLLYEVEIDNDDIGAIEEGVLSGVWINKKDLSKHYDSFESWSKIAYDNIIK